jgi:virginiamycin A acetyltransferase
MRVYTDEDFAGIVNHPWSKAFSVLGYRGGGYSFIPHRFFRNWLDEEILQDDASFFMGRCSGFGIGSIAKYDGPAQSLRIGRFVSGGLRLKFLLNGQHEMRTISTALLGVYGIGLRNARPPQYADCIIKNDVWLGDEVMMLGGGTIENGCVVGARTVLPPNFKAEPYGIYAGSPARLIRFRFSQAIIEALLDLAWWEMPLSWIAANNGAFLNDLTLDEGRTLETIAELKRRANQQRIECSSRLVRFSAQHLRGVSGRLSSLAPSPRPPSRNVTGKS